MMPSTATQTFASTREIGPRLNAIAPEFVARDHSGQPHHLRDLIGHEGLILGFIEDTWHEASVQRILWLERHAHTFINEGFNVALLICDKPHTLYGFYISSRMPPQFPLLADVNGEIHREFNMSSQAGLLLLNHSGLIQHKWLVPDDCVWPKIHEVMDKLATL